jgi:predicted tellurium resistance membrane protein TerC
MAGIIFFFKHPKLARFHRKHAPLSYVIYLIVMIIGLDILINSVVKNMYQPILEMSKIVK